MNFNSEDLSQFLTEFYDQDMKPKGWNGFLCKDTRLTNGKKGKAFDCNNIDDCRICFVNVFEKWKKENKNG